MRLKEIINEEEKKLENRLQELRKKFTHRGIKGQEFESAFRELLSQYVPKRLSVGTGQVIDSESGITKQIDVVIATEFHPGIIDPHSANLFFIEGLCGAGEIKTRLTTTELDSAVANCQSFKALKAKPVKSIFIGSEGSFRLSSPYFIFSMESDLSSQSIFERLNKIEPPGTQNKKGGPDLVVVRGKTLLFDPRGQDQLFLENENGEKVQGWTQIPETGLFDFMMLLLNIVPQVHHMENFMRLYSSIRSKEEAKVMLK